MSESQAATAPETGNDDNSDNDPEIAELLKFEPVPRRFKRGDDGWTAPLQRAFIRHLARHGSPGKACEALQKHRSGIDKVYKAPGAESFRAAWAKAVEIAETRAAERIEAEAAAMVGIKAPFLDNRRKAERRSEGGEETGAIEPREPLPVVCERCGAEGVAGDEAFATIPDLLAFDPVPRRPHDRHWDEPTQRAFIAALAASGSPGRAAKSVGRHLFGAEKLRKARGGRGFAEAWDAALEIARERELARMGKTLSELGQEPAGSDDLDGEDDLERRAGEARERINQRLFGARQLYLFEISADQGKRAAWETLCGPVDWDKAARLQRQDNEPAIPNLRRPDMLLPVENGWLGEVTGGEDKRAEVAQAWEEYQRTGVLPGDGE